MRSCITCASGLRTNPIGGSGYVRRGGGRDVPTALKVAFAAGMYPTATPTPAGGGWRNANSGLSNLKRNSPGVYCRSAIACQASNMGATASCAAGTCEWSCFSVRTSSPSASRTCLRRVELDRWGVLVLEAIGHDYLVDKRSVSGPHCSLDLRDVCWPEMNRCGSWSPICC